MKKTFNVLVFLLLVSPILARAQAQQISVTVKDSIDFSNSSDHVVNVIMRSRPSVPGGVKFDWDNDGNWSLICDSGLSNGNYLATYDQRKNKIWISGLTMKGKPHATKCRVYYHEWRKFAGAN